jgi:hypothetical protein
MGGRLDDIDDLIKDEEEEKEKGMKRAGNGMEMGDMMAQGGADDENAEGNIEGDATFIGTVERFFSKINVAAIRLTGSLKVGDVIEVRGGGETMRFTVSSMQIERADVAEAGEGDSVGIKVERPVTAGSRVYLVA